jgi:hypothetical protein
MGGEGSGGSNWAYCRVCEKERKTEHGLLIAHRRWDPLTHSMIVCVGSLLPGLVRGLVRG